MNEKIRNLAARIRQGGYVFASGGKLCRRYDGRTEDNNRLQFGWNDGVLDNALYPTLPKASVETKTAIVAGTQPSVYLTGTDPTWVDLHQSQIPEDASAIDAVLPGALFSGETLAKLPDVTPPFVSEGYRGERVLTEKQLLLMQALRNRGAVDRRSLQTNLLQNPDNVTVQPKMVSNDSVVDDGRGQYVEAKLLGESDASAAQRAAAALKNADVDTIKAVQAEMYRKGYYKDVKTPPIPMGTREQNMELQRKLKSYGYDLGTYGPDGVDGKIGAKTRAAWARYVKEHPDEVMLNSVADGKVGPATRRALAAYYKDVYDESLLPTLSQSEDGQLSIDEAKTLYQNASSHSALSASLPLAKLLFTNSDTSAMDDETKDQLAVLLTYYGDRINSIDSFSDAMLDYDSAERQGLRKKMSPLGYKHQGELSEQDSAVGVQDVDRNALSRVLGAFGAIKDKDGNYLIDDAYDNEVYRIRKEDVDSNPQLYDGINFYKDKMQPKYYIVTREDFEKLREAGGLPKRARSLQAIAGLAKDLIADGFGHPAFDNPSRTQRYKMYGENAIVKTGKSQKFNFVMTDKERKERVQRLKKQYLKEKE